MAFLIPALIALVCDIAVLYLHHLGNLQHQHLLQHELPHHQQDQYLNASSATPQLPQHEPTQYTDDLMHSYHGNDNHTNYNGHRSTTNNNYNGDDQESEVYFWVGNYYLVPLAIVRLLALMLPLLFHSYTGTAVRFPKLYQGLYGLTLMFILIHMLGLILLNPESLESILPIEVLFYTGGGQTHVRFLLQHLHALRRVWWMLVFSALSTVCHFILLQHVKSTAPSSRDPWLKRRQQPQSVYFAIRSRRRQRQRQLQRRRQRLVGGGDAEEEDDAAFMMDLMDDDLGYDLDDDEDDEQEDVEEEPALVQAVNEFLVDVQVRLRCAKQEWSKRLDDFVRHRMVDNPAGSASTLISQRSLWTNNSGQHNHHHNPFRVLLQLFAEQDVFDNGLLTAAFDWDHGQTLTFLVPQLLSFLLHGATTSSEQLEEWILKQCRTNIFFAHRCYWFLRAWCLEVPSDNNNGTGGGATNSGPSFLSMSRENSESQLNALLVAEAALHHHSRVPLGSQLTPTQPRSQQNQQQSPLFLDPPSVTETQRSMMTASSHPLSSAPGLVQPTLPSMSCSGHSNSSDPAVPVAAIGGAGLSSVSLASDKFMPQERAMIERLMWRVKECGESAARVLEYGSSSTIPTGPWNSNNSKGNEGDGIMGMHSKTGAPTTTSSPSSLMQVVERGAVPVDPITGRPSQRHLDCMAASQKYGFRPIVGVNNKNNIGSGPGAGAGSSFANGDSTQKFDKTPQFLDALIYIAEVLYTVPRETRKDELHSLLGQLECELLPDNAVYVPSTSHSTAAQLGRVWRIAIPECIPISTKERVPCILALEVVQWDTDNDGGANDEADNNVHDDRTRDFTSSPRTISKGQKFRTNTGDSSISNGSSYPASGEPLQTPDTTESSSPLIVQEEPTSWSLLDIPKRFALSSRSDSSGGGGGGGGVVSGLLSAEAILSTPGSLRRLVSVEGRGTSAGEADGSSVGGATSLLSRRAATGGATQNNQFISEAEQVREWRCQPRHPLRLIPLINRVGETMKGTMDRVKTTMKERFGDLRDPDRSVSEELQSLTQHQSMVEVEEEGSSCVARDGVVAEDLTVEVALSPANGSTDETNQHSFDDCPGDDCAILDVALSTKSDRATSVPSPPSSMGQWSSPPVGSAAARKRAPPAPSNSSSSNNSTLRHRSSKIDNNSGHNKKNSGGITLPYGSGDGNDKNRRRSSEGLSGITGVGSLSVTGAPAAANPTATVAISASSSSSSKPPPVVFRESWQVKQERVRRNSAYGSHPGWRLAPILIKANDDLRQEELASQLIYRMASILAREKVPVWLCPYEIIALTDRAGLIEAIPDTISIDSLKRNDPNYTNLRNFFINHYGEGTEELSDAKANFVESLAAYSMVCFLLQLKDRHNGNILIDSRGHVIHIDFGFFFLSSPGKNAGFESAPFKLTRDFMEVMDGPHSHLFHIFRELCVRSFLALRKHCMEIIVLVEMIQAGNEHLKCFRGRPDRAIAALRERFRLDLNDRACREYVHSLVDDSMENWRTDWYDRYQRYFVGVL